MTHRLIAVIFAFSLLHFSACSGQSNETLSPEANPAISAAGDSAPSPGDGVKLSEGSENSKPGQEPENDGGNPGNPPIEYHSITPLAPAVFKNVSMYLDQTLVIPYWLCQAHASKRWSGPKDGSTLYLSESVLYCPVSLPRGAKLKSVELQFYPSTSNSNFGDLNDEQGIYASYGMQSLATSMGAQWKSVVKGAKLTAASPSYKIEEIPGCSTEWAFNPDNSSKVGNFNCEIAIPQDGQIFFRIVTNFQTKDSSFHDSLSSAWSGFLPPPTFAVMAIKYSAK